MLDDWLLELVRCPVSHSPLRPADDRLLARVNDALARGQLGSQSDDGDRRPLEAALVNDDHSLLFPIRNGVPVLTPDQAIRLNPWNTSSAHGDP